jgi:hypothetical protein
MESNEDIFNSQNSQPKENAKRTESKNPNQEELSDLDKEQKSLEKQQAQKEEEFNAKKEHARLNLMGDENLLKENAQKEKSLNASMAIAAIALVVGVFFPPALIVAGLAALKAAYDFKTIHDNKNKYEGKPEKDDINIEKALEEVKKKIATLAKEKTNGKHADEIDKNANKMQGNALKENENAKNNAKNNQTTPEQKVNETLKNEINTPEQQPTKDVINTTIKEPESFLQKMEAQFSNLKNNIQKDGLFNGVKDFRNNLLNEEREMQPNQPNQTARQDKKLTKALRTNAPEKPKQTGQIR